MAVKIDCTTPLRLTGPRPVMVVRDACSGIRPRSEQRRPAGDLGGRALCLKRLVSVCPLERAGHRGHTQPVPDPEVALPAAVTILRKFRPPSLAPAYTDLVERVR